MKITCSLLAAACALATAVPAVAQHAGDVFLAVVDDQLATGGILPDESVDMEACVFEATFGDSGCGPFTANPGFDTLPGTFTTGTKLGWNALGGWRTWNGSGFVSSGGEFVEISFSSLDFTVQDDPAPGFDLFVQPNGGFHVHLDFCMDGCPDICDPTGADPGIYLLELELYSTDPGIATSDPFFLVFNYLETGTEHDAALAWADLNLCGAPACPADVDGDLVVNVDDLVAVIVAWGQVGPNAADVNGDLIVNVNDLVEVITNWGNCS